jgi:hypothetical protein
LDALRSLPERPHVPAPALAPPAEAAVDSPVAAPPDCARASTSPRPAAVPDSRDERIASLSFQVRELNKAAFRRSVATATAFVHDPTNELLSAPPARNLSVSPPPAGRQPAASPSPPFPPAKKLVLKWIHPASSSSSTAARWARRPVPDQPPWALGQ